MMVAQQEHRKKMNKMYKDTQNAVDVEDTELGRIRLKLQKLMAKQMSGSPAFRSRVESFKKMLTTTMSPIAASEIGVRMLGTNRDLNRLRVAERRKSSMNLASAANVASSSTNTFDPIAERPDSASSTGSSGVTSDLKGRKQDTNKGSNNTKEEEIAQTNIWKALHV